MNIFVLNKGGSKTGILSNQGANPPAPFFDDLYTQELETGADTYYFSTISNSYTQDLLYVGNKVMFEFGNKQKLFTIASIEYEHKDGQKIIGVYAEGIGFELLDIFMNKPKIQSSGSGSGNDSDKDGDDHLDDEYGDPDDVWIDEDGNIVYIKNNKENGSDYGSPDDVWIDEDGNICYKKNKSKNKNRDNSSLKLTNISYTKFLNLILKNTGWTYVVDPELDRKKQDMEIRYDTNIYAILQDSMQTYQGVELEFIYEYNNGNIRKVVKAYRNGGRGSITGKRLQYGVNIRGITKLQEIADEKEENIIYDESVSTVNGYRVQLTYDVDIALKSLDVHDMRIGDTYTVIDHEFRPAMQFNARIGKIEISFSDMTRNKCYLANFKKIKGAVSEDEENNPIEDIIKDTIEDYLEDDEEEDDDIGDGDTGGGGISAHYYNDNLFKAPRMHSYEFLLYTNLDGDPLQSTNSRTTDYQRLDSPINHGEHPTSEDMYNFLMNDTYVYDVSYSVLDNLEHPNIGGDPSNYCLRLAPNGGPGADRPFCLDHDEQDYMGECTMSLAGSRIFSDIINPETDRPDFGDPISADHHDRHMLDVGSLACGLVAALQHHVKSHDNDKEYITTDRITDSYDTNSSDTIPSSYAAYEIYSKANEAYDKAVEALNALNGDGGSGGNGIYATIEYADYIKDIANSAAAKATTATETAKSASNNVEVYSSLVNELKSVVNGWRTNGDMIDGQNIYPSTIDKEALKHNILTGDHVQKSGYDLPDNQILVTNDLSDSVMDNISNRPASSAAVKKAYDKAVEAYNNSGLLSDVLKVTNGKLHIKIPIEFENSANFSKCSVAGGILANLTGISKLECAYISHTYGNNTITIDGDLEVTGSITSSGGGSSDFNKYFDELVFSKDSDIIITNYFEDSRDAFISASELYEAVGWYRLNGPSTASIDLSDEQQETISELQATVQQQQETIATLEARLARLEQHLGLSDDI